jgi:hypothetical protein
MQLLSSEGDLFTTGLASYSYRPAINDISNRILLQVEIEGILVEAIVDTGSPYVVCPPYISNILNLNPASAIESIPFKVRGVRMQGSLHRLDVRFPAEEGDDLLVQATVFVPDQEWDEAWGEQPAFIGLTGCLERMRFAVDPGSDQFYFGPL